LIEYDNLTVIVKSCIVFVTGLGNEYDELENYANNVGTIFKLVISLIPIILFNSNEYVCVWFGDE